MLERHQLLRPIYTVEHSVTSFAPAAGSLALVGPETEERGRDAMHAWQRAVDIEVCRLELIDYDIAKVSQDVGMSEIHLRDESSLDAFSQLASGRKTYIDITSMSFQIWGPLVRALLKRSVDLAAVYVEAHSYRAASSPAGSELFDLSAGFEGVVQLPGFISLDDDTENALLVPLLGFEGQRFMRIVDETSCPPAKILPIIGVPGFRIGFPFLSYRGNQQALQQGSTWTRVRYAKSNCPFSAAGAILQIAQARADARIRLAPIGTRPHALGAVLASMTLGDSADILYDRPRKKAGRTKGSGTLLEYDLARHWEETSDD